MSNLIKRDLCSIICEEKIIGRQKVLFNNTIGTFDFSHYNTR